MFAITKAGKVRKEYVRRVRGTMTDVFNLSFLDVYRQNKIWEEWLGLKKECEPRDLCKLLNSDVNDAFKARAIAILLVPRIKLVPFVWTGDKRSLLENYLSHTTMLSKLSPQLQTFTIALLEINISMALMPEADENLRETLSVYNGYIIQSLALLPEDDSRAERLFERYQINDPVAWYNMVEGESGYKPFRDILASNVPEKWKCLADKKMREIIHAEEKGFAQPREKWERALPKYMDTLNACSVSSTRTIYSLDLLASQVEFILDLNTTYRMQFSTYTLLAMPDGESLKELRHRMVRHAMRIKDGGFTYGFHEGETLMNTSKVLEEFGNEEAELSNWLCEIIAEEKVREQSKSSSVSKEQERINAVVAKMK